MRRIEYAKAICYSGFRKGQNPRDEIYPTMEQVKEDLEILNNDGYKYLRMYEPNQHAKMVVQAIRELSFDMKLMVGIDPRAEYNNPNCAWEVKELSADELAENAKWNEAQLDELIAFAKANEDVVMAVSIGNENTPGWGSDLLEIERLAQFAKKLKENVSQIVTYNEGSIEWPRLGAIAKEVDVVSLHTYPLWFGNTVQEAIDVMKEHYKQMADMYPDKQIIFSECGWATNGRRENMLAGQASEANQVIFMEELNKWLEEEQVIAYIFEAFDEPWKGGGNVDEPETNWGLYYEDRTPKPAME